MAEDKFRHYRLRIPAENGFDPIDMLISDWGEPYWPFLRFQRNRDLVRLTTLRREEMIILDGEEIKVCQLKEKLGNIPYVHPRPQAQIKEMSSADDLLLLATNDICEDVYCFPNMIRLDNLGDPFSCFGDLRHLTIKSF